MDNKLIPHKTTFLDKIKLFFKRIFHKDIIENHEILLENENEKNIKQVQDKINFEKTIKVDLKDVKVDIKNMDLDEFLNNIEIHLNPYF